MCVCGQLSEIYIFSRNKHILGLVKCYRQAEKVESSERQTDIVLLVLVKNMEYAQPYPLISLLVYQLKLSTRRCITWISFKCIDMFLSLFL